MTRVAFIGSGSVSFTREPLSDCFGYGDLDGLAAHAGTLPAGL